MLGTFSVSTICSPFSATRPISNCNKTHLETIFFNSSLYVEYMMQLYSADLTSSGPDYHTFRSVLQALSKNVEKGTAQKAERVLSVMKAETDPAVKPDDTIYHVIMHIYSHNREMNAPQRAEKLLEEMHLRNHEGDESLKPSVITFNTLLNTYAKSFMEGAADRAEEVLDHMQMLHENGVKGVEPDCISFNTVLNCHASSGAKGSDRRAFGILTRMHELYATGRISVEPNARTYNACIKACLCSSISGTTEELDESMSLACKILSMVQYDALTSARADEYTYHWFFKVCKALCNDDQKRFTMVQWGFNFCQENGLVTSRIMDQVRDLVDSNLLVPYSVLPAKRGQTYSSPRSITTSLYSEPPRSPSSSGPEPRLLDFSATTSPVQPTSQSERSIWGSIDANNAQNCASSHTTVAKSFVFPPSTVPTSPPCNIATDSTSSMNDTFDDSQLHSRLISLCSSGDEF